MAKTAITIEIDQDRLQQHSDEYLAAFWHVAQINPAEHGDRAAGELVERIGREIIRRWLGTVPSELWHHQGRDHYWSVLRKLGKWNAHGVFVPDCGDGDTDANGDRP